MRRYCQLVLADTSLAAAQTKRCAVGMEMRVEPKEGGFMGVPLRAVQLGEGTQLIDMNEFTGGKEVYVIFDTGSQGFFVVDNTLGKQGKSFTQQYFDARGGGYGSNTGEYKLVLGDKGGATFTLTLPEQWMRYSDAPDLLRQKADGQPSDSQTLIVGNPWLQAISVTFDVSHKRVYLSHMDRHGRRVPDYAGPKSQSTELATASFSGDAQLRRPTDWAGGIYTGPQLKQLSLAQAADDAARTPKAADVCMDMRFMYYYPIGKEPTQKEGKVMSVEEPLAGRMILLTLDAEVTTAEGERARISQIVDTGSGISFVLNLKVSESAGNASARAGYYCAQGGTTADTFLRRYRLSGATLTAEQVCGACSDPYKQAHQLGSPSGCNTNCCLADGASCDELHQCTNSFCTGSVSYTPKVADLRLPSENGTRHLRAVKAYVAEAQSICVPGLSTGLWGFWYWNNPLETSGAKGATQSSGLPHYLLSEIGQVAGDLNNITFKFWREDLNVVPSGSVVPVGRAPKSISAPDAPFWSKRNPPTPSPPAPSPPTPSPPAASPPSPDLRPSEGWNVRQSGRATFNDGGVQQIVYVERENLTHGSFGSGEIATAASSKATTDATNGGPPQWHWIAAAVLVALVLVALFLSFLMWRSHSQVLLLPSDPLSE